MQMLVRVKAWLSRLFGYVARIEPVRAFSFSGMSSRHYRGAQKLPEAVYQAAFNGSLDACFLLASKRDPRGAIEDFVVLDINQRAERLIGRGRVECIGRRMSELLPAAGQDRLLERYARVTESGEALCEEFELSGEGRPTLWLWHQIIRVGDGVAVNCRDITERKDAELTVLCSEQRLRAITDNVPALVSYLDCDLCFRYANKAHSDWLGIDPDATTGKSLCEVIGAARFGRVRSYYESALSGQRVTYESSMGADSASLHVSVSLVPQFDADGKVVGLLNLVNDLSERIAAEQALRLSESRLLAVTDALPVFVSYLDTELRYRHVNSRYERTFKMKREDIVGRSVQEMVGEETFRATQHHIQAALAGTKVKYEQERLSNGRYHWIEGIYIPHFDEDGRTVLGLHSMIRDITAEKLETHRLRELSRHDPLTGLENRAGFDQDLVEAIATVAGPGNPIALFYMDVDYFKRINDGYGHLVGDAVLKEFAARLRRSVHGRDHVARLGGDEFAVILRGISSEDDAVRVAASIVENIRAPMRVDGQLELRITTSIGVVFHAGGATTPAQLLQRADEMLYAVKAAGRNGFQAVPTLANEAA